VDTLTVLQAAPALVVVPPCRYLMVDGCGDPATSSAFGAAVRSLHRASGAAAPLEALWWVDDDDVLYVDAPRETWRWTLLVAHARGVSLDEGLSVQVVHDGLESFDRLHEFVVDNGYRVRGRHHEIFRRRQPSIIRLPVE
jgi:hypothetical protein